MNKVALANKIAEKVGVSKKEAEQMISAFVNIVTETLKMDDIVNIAGFGAFSSRVRKGRIGVNPQNPSEQIDIPPVRVPKFKAGKIIAVAIIIAFIFSNLSAYKLDSNNKIGEYFVPQGAYLKELLQVVDYTYKTANGKDFSISTMTNPYRYNSLWAYLYSWYGKSKYGYLPSWYGNDQTGIFGANLLAKTETAKPVHFSIREPHEGMPIWLYQEFEGEQNNVATPAATTFFGTVEVKEHFAQNTKEYLDHTLK